MKTHLLFFLTSVLLWSCGAKNKEHGKGGTTEATQKVISKITEAEINRYHRLVAHFLDSTLLRGTFNGSILVAKEGEVVYEKYIGYKALETRDTLTAETPLQIASTSKPFTAAAVLQLIGEGKLDLNAPLSNYFPDFPYAGVTVKTLLNHRSGLPNYLYYMDKGGWERQTFATNNDVLSTLVSWMPPQAFKPNTHFNYCNTNYVLLALLVEKISGLPFPEYMQQTFFEPLQMTNTYVSTIADTGRLTPSYDWYGGHWKMDFSDGPYGDKNICSTPRDLLKWDQALYNGSILSEPLLDSAFTPYSNEKPSVHNYGLGWRLLMMPNGKKVVYHNGRWHGFNSAFTRLIDEKVTIIILSNRFNRNVYSVARRMYNLFGNYDSRQGLGEE